MRQTDEPCDETSNQGSRGDPGDSPQRIQSRLPQSFRVGVSALQFRGPGLSRCELVRIWLQRVVSTEGKDAQRESCELTFIWGKNEDYSPGDSLLDSSEKLLRRGRGEGQYRCDFGEGGAHAIKHIFFCRRLLLVTRSRRHREGF